jgi:hypothetical protein
VFSGNLIENTKHSENKFERVIIGAGALGLFLADRILLEYRHSITHIISNSIHNLPIYIQKQNQKTHFQKFPKFFLSHNLDHIYPNFIEKNIIIYVCLPPQFINKSFEYIKIILIHCNSIENVYLVFLNNGIIHLDHLNELKNTLNKNIKLHIIRGIVLGGFNRNILQNKIEIKNTSGNEVYYGFYNNPIHSNIKEILPAYYFRWNFTDKILLIEKSKFLINFILGLYIGKRLLMNSAIYDILSKHDLKFIFTNYCKLFPENLISPHFLERYFNKTIKISSLNTNSLSYAWYHGNTKPIEYFVANMKEMAYSSNNMEVQEFFVNLIDQQFQARKETY